MNIARMFFVSCILYVTFNVMGASVQIAKAHADRLASAMCEVTEDCRK